MNILFDASNLFSVRGGGIYNYLVKLLPQLIRQVELGGDELAFLHLYFRPEPQTQAALLGRKMVPVRFPVRLLNQLWIRTSMPDLSRWLPEFQVVHSPHFSLPVMSKAKKVLTVNDLTYLKHPEYFTPAGRAVNDYGYQFLLPHNVARADRIIAISEHTRQDLIEHFRLPEEKVCTVHLGCDLPPPIAPDELTRRLAKFSLAAGQYIYCPAGTLEPRKNIRRMVDAFAAVRPRGVSLVISGVGDASWLQLRDEQVHLLHWDTDDEKNALYQGALFVVYPSLYEGFGMPVVEAMGNRKAVLTSTTTSLGEIAEGYAHTVDPESLDALVAGLKLLIDDHAYRASLEEKSAMRARDFTWEQMAEKTCGVYRSLR